MVDTTSWLEKQATGNWIKADLVRPGDRLRVQEGAYIDPSKAEGGSFDRSYLIVPIILQRTNEEYKLRLGPKNVDRINQALTPNTDKWIGNDLEVISIETYPGLGKKGILLRGVKVGPRKEGPNLLTATGRAELWGHPPTPQGVSMESINAIRAAKDMIDENIPLNLTDFNGLPSKVRVELVKKGLVRRQGEGGDTVFFFFTDEAKKYLA